MLDEENLKKNTGKLGLYMIEDAQQEIKNIQRKILFQKAELIGKIMKKEPCDPLKRLGRILKLDLMRF